MKQRLILVLALLIVILAGVTIMMTGSSKPSTFEVKDGSLVISGQFATAVKLAEISELAITDQAPSIGRKTNGSGLGSVYKGQFTLADGAKARLYVDISKPPFLRFTAGDTVYVLNGPTADDTQKLFDQLSDATGK